jgi:hypothetical protein
MQDRQFTQSVIRQAEEQKQAYQKQIDDRLKLEEEYAREVEQIQNQIGQSLTDALMNGGMKARDFLINMFKTLVLRPILQPIITGITGGIMSAIGFSASAGEMGGGLGGAMGLSSIANSFSNAVNLVTGGFQALGATVSDFAVEAGFKLISSGMQDAGVALLESAGAIGTASSYLAGIGAGIGLGQTISGQFSVGGSSMVATGIGTALGAVIAGPLGAAIGGALGGVVNRAFGMGGTTTENAGYLVSLQAMGAEVQQFEDWKRKGGWFRSDQTGRNITEAAQEVNEFFNNSARAIGMSVQAMAQAVGVSTDRIGEFAQDVIISTKGFTEEEFSKQVEGYLMGLETSLVDFLVPAIWEFGSAADKTAADVLKRLTSSLMTVNQAFEVLGYSLYEMSLQGGSAASKLVDLFGGLEGFTAATSFYYENFYSAQEKVNFQTEQLTKIFGAMNAALPATREEFRALVEMAQAAGNDVAFANLLQLAPAFNALHDAMEQMGDTVENTADILRQRTQLETRLLQLQGNTAELRRRELEALDESNRALQEQIYSIEDATAAQQEYQKTLDSIINYAERLASTLEIKLSTAIQKTDAAFQSLVKSLEIELANKLNRLETTFKIVSDSIKSGISELTGALSALDDASKKTETSLENLIRSLEHERNVKISAYELEIEEQRKLSDSAKESATALRSIFDALQSGIDSLYGAIDSESNVARAFDFISETLSAAKTGGTLPESQRLSGAIGIATGSITPDRFGSSFEMRRSGLMLQNQLIELQSLIEPQLSEAEIQIQKADEQITLLQSQIEQAEINHIEQVEYYQQQLDALRGIDNSVLPLDQAIAEFQSALIAEQKAAIAVQNLLLNDSAFSREELLAAGQQQLDALEAQLELERLNHEAEVQAAKDNHTEQVAYYQAQLDAMRGVDRSVLSVVDAVNNLNSAMAVERNARADRDRIQAELDRVKAQPTREDQFQKLYYDILDRAPDPEGLRYWINSGLDAAEATKYFIDSTENRVQEVTRMYEDILKRAPDPAGLNYWVSSGGALQDIQLAIATSREAQSLRGFATGGYYPGGMALVGERGPELIDFSTPGMVYNNNQLRGAMGGGDTAVEIRMLREDNQAQSRAMVALQNRMTRLLERWDGDGLPEERMVEA